MNYAYIRAWGLSLGSFPEYIAGEVERARRDNAPETATYRREDGSWATFEEISSERVREQIAALVDQITFSKEEGV